MDILNLAKKVALECGNLVVSRFHTPKIITDKISPGDVYTDVDIASEALAIKLIRAERPFVHIFAEEGGNNDKNKSEYIWIIDPLDGTYNYVHDIPIFSVSVAVYYKNKPFIGVIYDPLHKEMFYAQAGKGAYLNKTPLKITEIKDPSQCVLYFSWINGLRTKADFERVTHELQMKTSHSRRLGSAAISFAYLAANRIHGIIESGLHPWDVAAGIVIIKEAGGIITDFASREIQLDTTQTEIICASPNMHSYIYNLMQSQ